MRLTSYNTVSYTHLDVYKRQRVDNLTNIELSNEECSLLSKVLQHNLTDYGKDMLIREVVNAEAVIKQIKNQEIQNDTRVAINYKLNRILQSGRTPNMRPNNEIKVAKNIKRKLENVDAMITKACLLYTSRCV